MQEENTFSETVWFLRRPVQFVGDLSILCAAFFLSYLPAINVQLGDYYFETALTQLPFVVFVQFASLFLVGAYSILWRYVSIEDIRVFLKAGLLSGTVLIVFRFLLMFSAHNIWQVPISVIVIDTGLAFGGMLGLRVLRRFVYEFGEKKTTRATRRKAKRKAALVVGAGRMGATLLKEIGGRADADFEIFGLLDDDARKKGGSVSGYKVLGTTADLPRIAHELKIEQVIIAIDNALGREVRRVIDICTSIPVKAQIVPSLNEIAHGRVSVSRLRDVQIEDLLGREPVKLDDENLHELITGKTVMVTGAGGSIGSELVRQISRFDPGTILLVERSEFFLFEIGRELRSSTPEMNFVSLLADVGDEHRMREIFEEYRPAVIFHAAAHKHVPLMEINSGEAIKNNVLATRRLGILAGEFGADKFVLISTDKAVNPTSVMGASKRVAEIVIQSLEQTYPTRYMAVRFGNVLGSAGSVVPLFSEQIRKGEPLTVTDKEMTRYFMTIPEAAQLVMQAGALGKGGEIFILDMGQPVKILDLAEDMIRLSGLTPYEDIDIVFTGMRNGEKLFEELEITGESLERTLHPKIFIGKIARYSSEDVDDIVARFKEAVEVRGEAAIRELFNEILPEASITTIGKPRSAELTDNSKGFTPPGSGLNLAEK